MRVPSRRSPSRRRNATSAANASIGTTDPSFSERPDNIEELLTVARLLHVGDLAAATIGNPRLGNLGVLDGVGVGDVFRPHDTRDLKHAHLVVDANFLLTLDHQI